MGDRLVIAAVLLGSASAHMSLVLPPSRNAADHSVAPWTADPWYPYQASCASPQPHPNPHGGAPSGCVPNGTDGWGCNCANGTAPCAVGQSCFWFSQGCTIGCEACDGSPSNPNSKSKCGSGMNATLCDPAHRTYNRAAACNSAQDVYRHNPWRAPGNAPVFDPCGKAGGSNLDQGQGGEAKYVATRFAKQGDLGAVLPAAPTGIVWKAGGIVTTKWSIRANHGGARRPADHRSLLPRDAARLRGDHAPAGVALLGALPPEHAGRLGVHQRHLRARRRGARRVHVGDEPAAVLQPGR